MPRKRDRIKAIFKSKQESPSRTSSPAAQRVTSSPVPEASATSVPGIAPTSGQFGPWKPHSTGFDNTVRKRYFDSVKLLEDAINAAGPEWGSFESFDFPELRGESDGFNDTLFKEKLASAMDARENKVKNRGAWAKSMYAVQCAFTAFSPFAKHFLTIAQQGQSVYPPIVLF